jgi:hypothetical protein
MAYAATGDLVKYVGRGEKLLSSSSPVSVSDLEKILDDIAYEIDGLLSELEVTLPVSSGTSPRAHNLLKRLNALGAAAYAELRLFGEAAPGARGTARHEILLAEYRRLFEAIRSGAESLIDAEGGTSDASTVGFSGSYKDDYGNEKDPFFTRPQKY